MAQEHSYKKIPFKVSARTARLIGRENIATSKGAIIELVKNGYDADSRVSLVYFDNEFSLLHNEITLTYRNSLFNKIDQHYTDLLLTELNHDKIQRIIKEKKRLVYLLSNAYAQELNNLYILKSDDKESHKELKLLLSKLATLYIIDNGEGMTANIINNHWMVIGTDNKHNDFVTKSGRIKAGAKGIGRFALDKLGSTCEMITIYNSNNHKYIEDEDGDGYIWKVNWEDFEGGFKTIDNVNAELLTLKGVELKKYIDDILPLKFKSLIQNSFHFKNGTILKITNLRDEWNDYHVDQVYSDLESLVPPEETGEFQIYLFSSFAPDKYGIIPSVICDDFDYKLEVEADDEQNVVIKVIRNEYDFDKIPKDFFQRDKMLTYPYDSETFREGEWVLKTTFSELMPGYKEIDKDAVFNAIGKFSFIFYFLKRGKSPEAEKFFHKDNLFNFRKAWLDKFGGIKIFRDNFRVRPYGEANDVAFDWLGLGARKAKSPAGIAKIDGGYKIDSESIAGAIHISRIENIDFEDKSSREGLQENKTFWVFRQLLLGIINVFEEDRAHIAREMDAYYDIKYFDERSREEAEKIVRRIYEGRKEEKNNNKLGDFSEKTQDEQEKIILAELNIKKDDEIEQLKEERKITLAMASSGIVMASFAHDLLNIRNTLGSRARILKNMLLEHLPSEKIDYLDEFDNPYVLINEMEQEDEKLLSWLSFSIGAARKDKRNRKSLNLDTYFKVFKRNWSSILIEKKIAIDIEEIDPDIDIRVLEIDMDSIFNNLLVNSLHAMIRSKTVYSREIKIEVSSNNINIIIDYSDKGPGLSKDILNPEDIFKPLFSTRRNKNSGEVIGTGIGMWLVKSIVEENDGKINLLSPDTGFAVRILLPIKYKRRT